MLTNELHTSPMAITRFEPFPLMIVDKISLKLETGPEYDHKGSGQMHHYPQVNCSLKISQAVQIQQKS